MNHSCQMVLCHLKVTLASLALLKSYEILVLLAYTLPFSEMTSSWTSVLNQGEKCGSFNLPLHNTFLSSDLDTGLVAVGFKPYLPFKRCSLAIRQ